MFFRDFSEISYLSLGTAIFKEQLSVAATMPYWVCFSFMNKIFIVTSVFQQHLSNICFSTTQSNICFSFFEKILFFELLFFVNIIR